MEVPQIDLSHYEAIQGYNRYAEAAKQYVLKEYEGLKRCYYYLKQGKKLINIYEAIRKAGLNEDTDPKIAVAKADLHSIEFHKFGAGAGYYSSKERWGPWNGSPQIKEKEGDTYFPPGFFNWKVTADHNLYHQHIRTIVPIVPAEVHPGHDLSNYHIIFEVEKWQRIPPKDPVLIRKITPNIAVILGTWNLTELEKAICEEARI